MRKGDTQSRLEMAAEGLLMMSESDYPFVYVRTNESIVSEELVSALAGVPAGTIIRTTTLDALLRNLTSTASGSVDENTAAQFRRLAETLKTELSSLSVYKVGEIQIDVFILGLSGQGMIEGLQTKLIET